MGVSQGAIAQWESGVQKPSAMAIGAISSIADGEERDWWLDRAGKHLFENAKTIDAFREKFPTNDTIRVPLLSGAVAAGSPRAFDEKDVLEWFTVPQSWFRRSNQVRAIKVRGDSMSPIIEEGYTVFIDVGVRDAKKLEKCMVAAREGDGVTIKWLRRDQGFYLLVPQHTSPRNPVRVMTSSGDFSIVGEVKKWIGEPPPAK